MGETLTAVREKPIIMSAESVRAILDGSKTQTRRVLKPQPHAGVRESVFVPSGFEDGHGREIRVPYRVGDRLWVREALKAVEVTNNAGGGGVFPVYAADGEWVAYPTGWCFTSRTVSPIHMPRWASRITLEVVGVRLQQLQESSDLDLLHEGIDYWYVGDDQIRVRRSKFIHAWNAINPKVPYDSNPWVWAISFRRLENV